jgi:hypothetical protein
MMFLIGPHGALLHNETHKKKYTMDQSISPNNPNTTHYFSAKGILQESWGRSMHWSDQRLLVPNKIGNPTYDLFSYSSGLAGSLD